MASANRIYNQYRNKEKFESWSEIPRSFSDEIIDACYDIKCSYDIDSNSGAQLDVIGNVIVEDRTYVESLEFTVYECNTDGDFECGDDSVQCSTVYATDDSELSDDYFKVLLKSKIQKNNGDATIDDILTAMETIAPDSPPLRLTDGEDMSYSIEFYGSIDEVIRDLLIYGDILPRPQGVKFNGFLEGTDMVECNADGDFECGDTSAECVGFIEA